MDAAKLRRKLYDKDRSSKLTYAEKQQANAARNARRKRKRADQAISIDSTPSCSDKVRRKLYDKERALKFTPEEKQRTSAARKARRKLLREELHSTPDIPNTSVYSDPLKVPGSSGDTLQLLPQPQCPLCGAKRFQFEPPTFCCSNGAVVLAPPTVPDDLRTLFSSESEEAVDFRKHIRAYNSMFSFTSFGVRLDRELANSRKGVYTFRVQGQAYHHLPSLMPGEIGPCYLQLYFHDTNNELENRLRVLQEAEVSRSVATKLMSILDVNPYAKVLRQLQHLPLESCALHICTDAQLDQRVYNIPKCNDVAAIWVEGTNGTSNFERDIVVQATSGTRHRVRHHFGCYDPLQYPLLFPYGEHGWHPNIPKKTSTRSSPAVRTHREYSTADDIFSLQENVVRKGSRTKVSCRQYYCYRLQIRDDSTILLLAKRLFLQFVVDMYIKLESTRLDFLTKQQTLIRADLYQGIVDSVLDGQRKGSQIGKRIVLPASFIGGPRYMRRRYLDATACVQRFGKPDFFITMTCNPEWPEIQQELAEGQTAQERPDLTARIFRAKLQDLKDQLFKRQILGKVAAHVHVVEFQKRGLPHAHILLILKPGHKVNTVEQYDRFISAEIPDATIDPDLHKKVIKHMMHGPCGKLNPKNSCMRDSRCKSHYPRPFCEATMEGKDSYPIYRRRCTGVTVKVRKQQLDNTWVVPYNPYLLSRYDCHLNVEICSDIKAVKYLYKYIYKGHDRIAFSVVSDDDTREIDEIKQFQEARCVTSVEAAWRIYKFELNEITPAVFTLQLHLPNFHIVAFQEYEDLRRVLSAERASKTMLTEFFSKCAECSEARKHYYRDFPEYYVWDKDARQWRTREKKTVIGRLCSANPTEGERYYLRILIEHVRGPTSFDDLLTFSGVKYMTFKEAAEQRGLLASDDTASRCMTEAATFQMPEALRRLFASILLYLEPPDVKKLWDANFTYLSEDYASISSDSGATVISRTIQRVAYYLESMGSDVYRYDLPHEYLSASIEKKTCARVITDELAVQTPPEDKQTINLLNEEQKLAYKKIADRIYSGEGGAFFIDGPGGTGKTYLYRALLWTVRSRGDIAIATATSGVAASILPGGRTAHSRFGIPLIIDESSTCDIKKQSATAELLRRAKLIIWDEAPMAKRYLIESVDRCLQDIMSSPSTFGGKVIVFGGDFRQVLPVVPRATRGQVVNETLAKSYVWDHLEKLYLTRNMRALSDPTFSSFLLRVGNGEEPTNQSGKITIPTPMVVHWDADLDPELTLINHVYPSLAENAESTSYITSRAILATKNKYVDVLNDRLISMFPGETCTYHSFDEGIEGSSSYYPEDFLNTLLPSGFPPHSLILKPHCPVILLRNIDPPNGLCNGTRLVCKNFERNVIHAEISTGQHAGKSVFIHRIPLIPIESENDPIRFKRTQFPIRLAFSMTINRAQGQTIPNVGVYLPQSVFSHGQLYVALSRGISMETTKVMVQPEGPDSIASTSCKTKNIVYKEVLNL